MDQTYIEAATLSGKPWPVPHRPYSISFGRAEFALDVTWLRGSRELMWSALRMEIDGKTEHERYSILPLAQFE
jgi:hypothetical protein